MDEVDKGFYVIAEYILKLAQHSIELFKRSEYEERRLLIKTVLLNATWDGVSLCYDYKEPFNLLVEMNESTVWDPLRDSNPCFSLERAFGWAIDTNCDHL